MADYENRLLVTMLLKHNLHVLSVMLSWGKEGFLMSLVQFYVLDVANTH